MLSVFDFNGTSGRGNYKERKSYVGRENPYKSARKARRKRRKGAVKAQSHGDSECGSGGFLAARCSRAPVL
eukprot:1145807-Pelagomonas_calceolata.AAC.2